MLLEELKDTKNKIPR